MNVKRVAGMTRSELKLYLEHEYGQLLSDIQAQEIINVAKRELLKKALERQIERKYQK